MAIVSPNSCYIYLSQYYERIFGRKSLPCGGLFCYLILQVIENTAYPDMGKSLGSTLYFL